LFPSLRVFHSACPAGSARDNVMPKIRVTFFILLFACLAGSGFPAEKPGTYSRVKEAVRPAEQEKAPEDPLGRSTPQGTVIGFLKAATQGDDERALQYLDTKRTGPGAQKIIHALQVILERGSSGKPAMLSSKPEGNLDDNLPPNRERIGTIQTSSGSLDILLERVQRGSGPPIWLFCAETLAKVAKASRELGASSLEDYLPKFLVSTWVLWFPLWRWLVILLVIPLLYFLSTLLTRLVTSLLLHYSRGKFQVEGERPVVRLTGPIRILIFASAIWVLSPLSQSVLARAFWAYVASTVTVMGATWLGLRIIDIFFDLKEKKLAAAASDQISLVQLGRKLVKILALMVGALFIFYIAGINLTAVIAGLGVGGIAVALAAQKTLENLFGGITVVSDQPIRVGDFCRAGEFLGTVLAIGLRSTRIRTLDRTIVSIPNGQLALMNLENFTMRDKTWFHHTLSLRYETTAEQLRYILAGIREMLYGHPKIESSSARVRFIGFGDSSLNLEVFAYVLETDYAAFLHIQEDLLLRIMDIVSASGSGFAFPSQTTYLAQDTGLDAGKSQEAIRKVREWRGKRELPFPDFSPETIAKIDNQIEYPPPDSARGKSK
jgi:MscS family membrane protein